MQHPRLPGVPLQPGSPSADAMLVAALEELEVSVCIADAALPDQPLVWVNAAFTRTTGYTADEALGRNCRFLQDGLPVQPQVTRLRAAVDAQEAVTLVLLNCRKDGSRFHNEVSLTPLHDDEGHVTHFVALQRDVTRAVEDERARRDLEDGRSALARSLQGGLVPTTLPTAPGLDVAVRFLPGQTGPDGSAVSGDFYDLYATTSSVGGAATWNATMGDVEGRGPGAAAYTATVRNLLKGITLSPGSPARALGLLNSALLDQLGDRFVTVVLAQLQVRQDRVRATLALGGHPQPVAVRGGEATLVGEPGDLLGVLPEVTAADSRVDLAPGDLLLLYTDGITEAGRPGEQFGQDRLLEVGEQATGAPAESVADAVLAAVRQHGGDGGDDAALLVVRVPGG